MTYLAIDSQTFWGLYNDTRIDGLTSHNALSIWGDLNHIQTYAGNDWISSYGFSHTIDVGNGNNVVHLAGKYHVLATGAGADAVYSYGNNHQLDLGEGDDIAHVFGFENQVYLGAGNDRLRLHGENNTASTGAGADDVRLHAGNNHVDTGDGSDTVYFYSANNYVYGGGGDDYLYDFWSVDRENTIDGGAGNDFVYLGGGDDKGIYQYAENIEASDIYHGGKGIDTLTLSFTYDDITALLAQLDEVTTISAWLSAVGTQFNQPVSQTVNFTSLGFDLTAIQFETIEWQLLDLPAGSGVVFDEMASSIDTLIRYFDETVNVDETYFWGWYDQSNIYVQSPDTAAHIDLLGDNNQVLGGDNNDVMTLFGNNNQLKAGLGDDSVAIYGNNNDVEVLGGKNTLTIHGDENLLSLQANENTVHLTGQNNTLLNASGRDNLKVYGENNVLTTAEGNDTVRLYADTNTIDLGAGDDQLYFHSEHNVVIGGAGDDTIYDYWTTDRANTADGGAGDDYVYLGGGDDLAIYHFAENKTAYDRYHGGKGVDTLSLVFEYADVAAILDNQLNTMTYNDWVSSVQTAFLASQTSSTNFNALGFNLDATHFETLDLIVNNLPQDSELPEISVADAAVVEGNHLSSHQLQFTITLSESAKNAVSFDYSVGGLSAGSQLDADFQFDSGKVIISPGERQAVVTINVHGDNQVESDETLEFMISNAEGASIVRGVAVGTIVNDDAPSSIPLTPPLYNSKAGSDNTIYLDFDGHDVTGTVWGVNYAKSYSDDLDNQSFNASERAFIQDVWQRVAEDYAPFDVNVTTDYDVYLATAATQRGHALITPSNEWYGSGIAWGASYTNVFSDPRDAVKTSWIFSDNTISASRTADTISHEIGHSLGLSHDLYNGHGSGETSWAPIMGTNFNKQLSQWSDASYSATRTKDDIEGIRDDLGFRQDDHANNLLNASLLHLGEGVNGAGIIETRDDVDVFRWIQSAGSVNLSVRPLESGANLDILAVLKDADGNVLQSSNPLAAIDAEIQYNLETQQTLYLEVSGTGNGSPLDEGYTDYGSLGYYSISLVS